MAAAVLLYAAPAALGGRDNLPSFNVTAFGAKGDNKTLNTHAFQKAVETIAAAGGGTLVVPDGAYRTGPFNLTSHMTLYLTGGASIFGPTAEQLGKGPAFAMWPIIPPMPSYGQVCVRARAHVSRALPSPVISSYNA